jgi:galactokinase
MIDLQELTEAFAKQYQARPRVFYAPGRVNLIGEHTDYNGGFVLPMAIGLGTAVAAAGRPGRRLHVWSLNMNEAVEIDLGRPGPGRSGSWTDYVEGVASALLSRGVPLTGADAALKSDVPIGSGLGSSAALEISLGLALACLSDSNLDRTDLAMAGQKAEHVHVGIQSGIMDQFVSVHAQKNHAILLDCRSLEARQIPLRLDGWRIVICDSRVRHTLAGSEYNRRREDCETAVGLLRSALPHIRDLRDVSPPQFEELQTLLPETVRRRCRHVVSENARVLKAAEALSAGNIGEMGALMSASHQSLREDYEVSCRELDCLVEAAMAQRGVLGARMTGGGFGGCVVALVEAGSIGPFREAVSRQYEDRIGITPEVLEAEADDGAREIPPDYRTDLEIRPHTILS